MLDAVDIQQSPISIYREWLGSLPVAGYGQGGEGQYTLRAWLDEVTNPTQPAIRPWLDEINNPRTAVRPWLDEVTNPRTAVRPWLDEVANPRTAAMRAWLDEWVPEPRTVASSANVINRGGAYEAAVSQPQGRVRVWLPNDMAAGDTITGTVVAEPAGRDDAQRRTNGGTLEGYVVDVGGTRTPVSAGRFTFTVPATMTRFTIGLMSASGPLWGANVNVPATPAPRPEHVQIPPIGQAGRPLEIPGNFDGNAANTSVSVGGQPGEVIAESPRQAVVWTPPEAASNSNITVSENGQTTQAPYRSIRIDLSSPRTNLQRGEQTQLHVQVQGLEGLTEPVSIRLEASSSVQMAGGNVQTVAIHPTAVGPGGVFQTDRSLQATQSGPFTVAATLLTPSGAP